ARVHAPGLEITAHGAARNLTVSVLPRQPDLDVVSFLRGEAHVASAEQHGAVMESEAFQDLLGASRHALMLREALLRCGDRDELDLGELVLTDHAAGVFARGAGFRAEAGRPGCEADRKLGLVQDLFANEV